MPTAYKILGQVATATAGATTEATLYTVPSANILPNPVAVESLNIIG
jgi:hypothetical protein